MIDASGLYAPSGTVDTYPAKQTETPLNPEKTIAERLYGQPTPPPAPTPDNGDKPSAAEALYGESARTFDVNTMPEALVEKEAEWGFSREELAKGYGDIRHEYQIPPTEFNQVVNLMGRYSATPPDAATLRQWTDESTKMLNNKYGKDANALLAKAQELVKANPILAGRLEYTGLASHPEVVRVMIESTIRLQRKR